MDTGSLRPRARIGFMRRPSAGADVSLPPAQSVTPTEAAHRTPALEPLREQPQRPRRGFSGSRDEDPSQEPDAAAADVDDAALAEDHPPLLPRSLMRWEPLPADGWLKRAFASACIARYRKLTRRVLTGRREDMRV